MHVDAIPGWRPIERVSALVVHRWAGEIVRVTRWESPTGVEGTVVAVQPVMAGGGPGPIPVVSSPALARDLRLSLERCVLDPQMCWDTRNRSRIVVCPTLGVTLGVPAALRYWGGLRGRARFSLTSVAIEAGADEVDSTRDQVVDDWQFRLGRHRGVATRWPLAVPGLAPARSVSTASPRLATGPASLCRDRIDEGVGV